jgi:hypothetical protein
VNQFVEMPPERTLSELPYDVLPDIAKVASKEAPAASVFARIIAGRR